MFCTLSPLKPGQILSPTELPSLSTCHCIVLAQKTDFPATTTATVSFLVLSSQRSSHTFLFSYLSSERTLGDLWDEWIMVTPQLLELPVPSTEQHPSILETSTALYTDLGFSLTFGETNSLITTLNHALPYLIALPSFLVVTFVSPYHTSHFKSGPSTYLV